MSANALAMLDQIRHAIIPPNILQARDGISDRIKQICDELREDPARIAAAETALVTAKQALEDAKSQIDLVDAELYEDELYHAATNDTKRKQALAKLRAESEGYREADAAHRRAKAAVEQASIEVRRAEGEQKMRVHRLGGMKAQVQLYFGSVIE